MRSIKDSATQMSFSQCSWQRDLRARKVGMGRSLKLNLFMNWWHDLSYHCIASTSEIQCLPQPIKHHFQPCQKNIIRFRSQHSISLVAIPLEQTYFQRTMCFPTHIPRPLQQWVTLSVKGQWSRTLGPTHGKASWRNHETNWLQTKGMGFATNCYSCDLRARLDKQQGSATPGCLMVWKRNYSSERGQQLTCHAIWYIFVWEHLAMQWIYMK